MYKRIYKIKVIMVIKIKMITFLKMIIISLKIRIIKLQRINKHNNNKIIVVIIIIMILNITKLTIKIFFISKLRIRKSRKGSYRFNMRSKNNCKRWKIRKKFSKMMIPLRKYKNLIDKIFW